MVTQIGPIASTTWYWLYLRDCMKKQIKIKNVLHRVGLRVLGYMGSGNRKLNNNKVYEMVFNCKDKLLNKEGK